MLGDLPPDFLRVLPISNEQQLSLDEQTAIALQHQYTVASSASGRLTVSVVEVRAINFVQIAQNYIVFVVYYCSFTFCFPNITLLKYLIQLCMSDHKN